MISNYSPTFDFVLPYLELGIFEICVDAKNDSNQGRKKIIKGFLLMIFLTQQRKLILPIAKLIEGVSIFRFAFKLKNFPNCSHSQFSQVFRFELGCILLREIKLL